MAIETRVAQKDKLFDLLLIKAALEEEGQALPRILTLIIRQTIASMEAEDVAYVQQQIDAY